MLEKIQELIIQLFIEFVIENKKPLDDLFGNLFTNKNYMFKYIYGTCRDWNIKTLDMNYISLNWWYNIEFFNQWQFLDFSLAWITKLSLPIPLEKYNGTIPVIDENEQPTWETIPKLTRFVVLKYSDIYTNSTDLTTSIEKSWASMNVQMFSDIETAIQWIKDNTSLQEVEEWKFLLSPETEMIWEVIPAKYLIIE